jgi:hypothetical protein
MNAPECSLWAGLTVEVIDEFSHRLAAAVVLSAVLDAASVSPARARRKDAAIDWLCDPENDDTWFSLAGVDRRRVLIWVQAGCSRDQLISAHKAPVRKYEKPVPRYRSKTESGDSELTQVDPDLGIDY